MSVAAGHFWHLLKAGRKDFIEWPLADRILNVFPGDDKVVPRLIKILRFNDREGLSMLLPYVGLKRCQLAIGQMGYGS